MGVSQTRAMFFVLVDYTLAAFLFLSSRFPQASGDVGVVSLMCAPVDLINRCTVTWNAHTNGSDVVATAISYNVTYFGENITNGSVTVDDPMAIINLPAVDSDVNVFVTAMNASGSGPASNITVDKIMCSSVINVTATLDTPNENRTLHSITVNCTINPDSIADMCEVMATANGHYLTGTGPTTNSVATVTVNGLMCEAEYTITAGGTLHGNLIGPRSSYGNITTGLCPETSPRVIYECCACDCGFCLRDELSIAIVIGPLCIILIIIVTINIIIWCCCICCRKYASKRSPRGKIPMNLSPTSKATNPDSKEPTSHNTINS